MRKITFIIFFNVITIFWGTALAESDFKKLLFIPWGNSENSLNVVIRQSRYASLKSIVFANFDITKDEKYFIFADIEEKKSDTFTVEIFNKKGESVNSFKRKKEGYLGQMIVDDSDNIWFSSKAIYETKKNRIDRGNIREAKKNRIDKFDLKGNLIFSYKSKDLKGLIFDEYYNFYSKDKIFNKNGKIIGEYNEKKYGKLLQGGFSIRKKNMNGKEGCVFFRKDKEILLLNFTISLSFYTPYITKDKNLILISRIRGEKYYNINQEQEFSIERFNKKGKLIFKKTIFIKMDYYNGHQLVNMDKAFYPIFNIKPNGDIYFAQLLKTGVEICKLKTN